MSFLILLAVIPPVFLLWKIYNLDKIEKEPRSLILRLFIFGAITVFPAMFIEIILSDHALAMVLSPTSILYIAIENFIIVAGTEEFLKRFVLKRVTWNNPNFNYCFDGVVYAVASSLGFAALENIFYIVDTGISTAIMRAVLSIPGHCIFGIYMGYHYGLAKHCEHIGDEEGKSYHLRLSLITPVLLHGLYDFCLSTGYDILIFVFFVYVIVLDVVAYRAIKRMASEDQPV